MSARPLRRVAAGARRSAATFSFGILAQAFSAATNFGLVVISGHLLGPGGLGTLLIGFAAYILLLGFLRALVTDPLVAQTSGSHPHVQRSTARAALTLAASVAFAATAL